MSGAAALLIACGVSLGNSTTDSELFTGLSITGEFTTGAELTLKVDYAQSYPVSLNIVCDLLEPGRPTPTPVLEPTSGDVGAATATPTPVRIPRPQTTPTTRILQILDEGIAPNGSVPTVTTQGEPFSEVTPVLGSLTRAFRAPDRPGRYIARCYTPADDNNRVRKTIRIRPKPTAVP